MREKGGLPKGLVGAVVVGVLLAVVVSGDWLLIVPAALALGVAGMMASSPKTRRK